MSRFQRVKSATGWGLFLGLCDWVLASGMTNRITREGVWAIILAQVWVGFLVGIVRWNVQWWIRGLVFGIGINGPLAMGFHKWGGDWGNLLDWPLFGMGVVIGFLIAFFVDRKEVHLEHAKKSSPK